MYTSQCVITLTTKHLINVLYAVSILHDLDVYSPYIQIIKLLKLYTYNYNLLNITLKLYNNDSH